MFARCFFIFTTASYENPPRGPVEKTHAIRVFIYIRIYFFLLRYVAFRFVYDGRTIKWPGPYDTTVCGSQMPSENLSYRVFIRRGTRWQSREQCRFVRFIIIIIIIRYGRRSPRGNLRTAILLYCARISRDRETHNPHNLTTTPTTTIIIIMVHAFTTPPRRRVLPRYLDPPVGARIR